jgi:hypothetical protein
MNGDSRSVTRNFKLVVLSLSLSALSLVAAVATAQQRPDELRNEINYGAPFGVRAAEPGAPAAGSAVASTALDKVSAESRDGRATSDKVSGATSAHHRVPVVTDWSTKHVVFAKPRTEKDAARLEHNTRYKMQVARRNAPAFRKVADARVNSSDLLDRFRNRVQDPHSRPSKADAAHRDWSVSLGGTGATLFPPSVGDGQFPAKFSFDINAAPDCTNDFVVYNTNTSMLVAFNNLYSGTDSTGLVANGTCTDGDGDLLSAPTVMWAYNVNEYSDGVTTTSVTLSEDGSQVAFIENALEGAVLHIVKWHAGDGSVIAPVTLWPARDVTGHPATWANNCGGTYPACMWSVPFSTDWTYSTSSGGDVSRQRPGAFSRKPSPDYIVAGSIPTDTYSAPYYDYFTDIIYVGTDTANVHQFINIFNGGATTGPSENASGDGYSGWPVYVNQTATPNLTGPIEDDASGRIFVSDIYGDLMTIETNTVPHIAGPCNGQPGPSYLYPCLADGFYDDGWNGIPDPPVVDSSLGTVMVFSGSNQVTGDGAHNGDAFAAQSLTTGGCVCGDGEETGGSFVYADFGPAGGLGFGANMHDGDFDNSYYNSDGAPGGVTGFMYVCAIDPLGADGGGNTALRQLSFGANGLLSGVSPVSLAYLAVATSPYDECSPVTEIYNTNTGTDLVFFSVQNHSLACSVDGLGGGGWPGNAPAGGCLMSFDVTNDASEPFSTLVEAGFAAFLPVDGGTSGIIIDNISPDPQASSVYFTPLGDPYYGPGDCTTTGCAAKATQVGLQ